MKFYQAILFDVNGTLIDIWTDEGRDDLYRTMANLLNTYGVMVSPEEFRTLFFELMRAQREARKTDHPEFDVIEIFRTIFRTRSNAVTHSLSAEKRRQLPIFLAETFRAASMFRLTAYPGVHQTLDQLRKEYTLGIVSDAQKIWAESELTRLDLLHYFPLRVISSEYGFRKPAEALFETALTALHLPPEKVIYVGNDMHRDVYGAKRIGMKSVWFRTNQGDQRPHGAEPDYIIYNFPELLNAVQFLEKQSESR